MVDVTWDVCTVVVNICFNRGVELHDLFHEFRKRRGMGTANPETKLSQHLSRLAHEPLFQVFLYVCKAYKSLKIGR